MTADAVNMIEKYAKSHGLHIPDALIASTAMCSGMELLTFNLKDFKFIEKSAQAYTLSATGLATLFDADKKEIVWKKELPASESFQMR